MHLIQHYRAAGLIPAGVHGAAILLCLLVPLSGLSADKGPVYKTESLRGRVVFLAEELENEHHIRSVPEAKQRILALKSDDGQFHPLLEDVRGRAFRADERLRKIDVELLVRRYEHSPVVQVIRVFEMADDGKYEIDYWCEICSIAMFELKPCECCQGEIELRRQKVK